MTCEEDVNEDKYALFIFWIKARISLESCLISMNVIVAQEKKNSPVVITNHSWVHLSWRSIKITPRMSGLCGPADCCLLQQQVERNVFFLLMQPSCSKAGPEKKFWFYKINPFRKLKNIPVLVWHLHIWRPRRAWPAREDCHSHQGSGYWPASGTPWCGYLQDGSQGNFKKDNEINCKVPFLKRLIRSMEIWSSIFPPSQASGAGGHTRCSRHWRGLWILLAWKSRLLSTRLDMTSNAVSVRDQCQWNAESHNFPCGSRRSHCCCGEVLEGFNLMPQ